MNAYQLAYPEDLVERALGRDCVYELKMADPRPWADHAVVRDRAVINGGAVAYWVWTHFKLNVFRDEHAEAVEDVDPLAERIIIHGRAYLLPHWCYLSTGIEPGDRRPIRWTGLPRPKEIERGGVL